MRRGKRRAPARGAVTAALAAAALLAALTGVAAALSVPPPPTRRVSDYAGVLAPGDVDRLERQLVSGERGSTNQIAVAVFRSLEGESLEDFSVRLAERWRIGQKGQDNGVIFLLFVEDRKMRIEVGYGLEATLTDALSASILREQVAPHLRQGRMADGIAAGLTAIQQAIAGTYQGQVRRRPGGRSLLPLAILAGVGVAGAWSALMAWNRRRTYRGGWVSPSHRLADRRGSGWGVGPWVGGGGTGGGGGWGGGGFGGGGGGFGGGGASGDW